MAVPKSRCSEAISDGVKGAGIRSSAGGGGVEEVLRFIMLGQWLRARINQLTFRRIVLAVLVVIALNLLRRAIAGI
jgi:hypothetical protein